MTSIIGGRNVQILHLQWINQSEVDCDDKDGSMCHECRLTVKGTRVHEKLAEDDYGPR